MSLPRNSSYLTILGEKIPIIRKWIDKDSPDELVLLLDSLISSSLCPHTKDWICSLYLQQNTWVQVELDVYIDIFRTDQNLNIFIKYRKSPESVPLDLLELASYILDLKKPYSRIAHLEQAKLWKLTNKQWRLLYYSMRNRIRPRCKSSSSNSIWQTWNAALWFAVQGTFTLGDFLRGRSLERFIEDHWKRLLSQSDRALRRHWSWEVLDDCRCPGYEFASLLAPRPFASLGNHVADAVLKEIMSHIDPRILRFMEPDLCQFEDSRCRASKSDLEDWYTPKSPAGRWKSVSDFKALAAVSDRLVDAFERIKDDTQFTSMAQAQLTQDCDLLASQIKGE